MESFEEFIIPKLPGGGSVADESSCSSSIVSFSSSSEDKNNRQQWFDADYKQQKGGIKRKFKDDDKSVLTLAAERFIQHAQTTMNHNQEFDIKGMDKVLDIAKRRVYDILHVLEGIGQIESVGKNKCRYKWIQTNSFPFERRQHMLQTDINKLAQTESELDAEIAKANNSVEALKIQVQV